MVEMPAIKTMVAGHATNVTTHATDVTSAEAAAHATAMTATAPTPAVAHQR
jgi:hypothetical protein